MIKVTETDSIPVPLWSRTQILFHMGVGEQQHTERISKAAETEPASVHVHTKQNMYGGTTGDQESMSGKAKDTERQDRLHTFGLQSSWVGVQGCGVMLTLHQTAE